MSQDTKDLGTGIRVGAFILGGVMMAADLYVFGTIVWTLVGLGIAVAGEITRDVMHWVSDR